MDGGTSLYLASYINLSEDMLPAPECNEVENCQVSGLVVVICNEKEV